jgi:molybdate transport repressor ModE-like protein
MIDPRRLQVIQAVAREGSLSAAARSLGYTQPAISHHVAQLEAQLGTALVTRLGRGVRLTDAGRAVAEHADDVLGRMAAAEAEVAEIAGLRAGRVRLAAFPSGSATLVPAALAALRAEHPLVEVTFVEAEPGESLPLLRAGELDVVLGFSYDEEPDAAAGFDHLRLLDDPLHAVLPAGHRLAARKRIRLTDLAEETWIAGCPQCRGHLLHVCAGAGFEPSIAFGTDDYVAVQGLVAAGLGVALLPALSLSAATNPSVVVRPVAGSPGRTIEAVTVTGTRRPPAVTAMLAALTSAAAAS